MSIASYSVVGRILAEVQQAPLPSGLVRVEQERERDQILSLHRSAWMNEPPLATSFHFWAHALRAFLLVEGRPDLFEAMAAQALCKAVEGAALADGLRAVAARVDAGPPLPTEEGLRLGYRMIDQDVMESWVAEHDDGMLALFWVRPSWLVNALPYEPEDSDSADSEALDSPALDSTAPDPQTTGSD